jgi:hypothetical protein
MTNLNISNCQKLMMTKKPKSSAICWRNMMLVTSIDLLLAHNREVDNHSPYHNSCIFVISLGFEWVG